MQANRTIVGESEIAAQTTVDDFVSVSRDKSLPTQPVQCGIERCDFQVDSSPGRFARLADERVAMPAATGKNREHPECGLTQFSSGHALTIFHCQEYYNAWMLVGHCRQYVSHCGVG